MEQGELIEKMVSGLYKQALDVKYGFNQFAVPWGNRYSDTYYQKKVRFNESICQFAKDCGIMALNKSFYYFNGKIYEQVSDFSVGLAYDQLMMKLGISSDYPTSITVRREKFMNIIIAYSQLNVRNDVIAFSNRVVDLRYTDSSFAGTHAFSPKWHVVDYHDYPFTPGAKCPMFMRFLNDVLPDKRSRDILQMFMGLGLIQSKDAFSGAKKRSRAPVELCLILLGSGANGKSVLFNIMCALFGKQHVTSVDYDTITADGDEGLRGRAAIRSAVFNWSSDSDARKFGQKNTAMFKRIVSGEPFQYRLLGKNLMESKNCPYLIFSLNQLPEHIADFSHGMLRRLQFVSFERTIPRYQQDPNLAFKIIDTELPGIFNWVVRGAREIRRRGFLFPSSDASLKLKVRSLLATNPMSAWCIAYGIRPEPLAPTETATLFSPTLMYKCFSSFCEFNDSEDEVLTQNKFTRKLAKMGFEKKHRTDGDFIVTYGIQEEKMRNPMSIDMVHDDDDDKSLAYEKDPNSYIKND